MGAINLGGGGGKKILDQIHKHHNMPIIDELNEANGNLTYKGKEIITNSTNSTILATQVVETPDRKFVNKKEKDALSGVKGNIQAQIDVVKLLSSEAMKFKGRFNSYAEMIKANPSPDDGHTTFVDTDETQSNCKTIYVYKNTAWIRARKDDKSNGWIASPIAPIDKSILWLDTSGVEPKIKWFNGSIWVDVSGLTTVPASKVIQETELKFVNANSDTILKKLSEDTKNKILLYDGKPLGGGGSLDIFIKDDIIGIDSTFSSFKITEELKKRQMALGYVPENKDTKGKADGYAPLNSKSKVSREYLFETSFIRDTKVEMNAITDMVPGNTCYLEPSTEMYIYAMSNEWLLITKGNAVIIGKHNLEATRNPVADDDERHGHGRGSIWINTLTDKAYICTNAATKAAHWEMMAGEITLNIGEIIPFKLDPLGFVKVGDRYHYEIPDMNLDTDFIELTLNGHELIRDTHYILLQENGKSYFSIAEELKSTDYIFGETYKYDLDKAEEQMIKSMYDSNNNGKVDLSELADRTRGFNEWTKNTLYEMNDIVLVDGVAYTPKETHTSSTTFINSKWNLLKTEAVDLIKFTTDDLAPTSSRQYVTLIQLADIDTIKSVTSRVVANERNISVNTRDISVLKSSSEVLKDRLDKLRFTQLIDTTTSLPDRSFLKVVTNYEGKATITTVLDPMFDIKDIIDSTNTKFNRVSTPKFNHLKMSKQDGGIFEFSLDATTFELNDMPKLHEHGKVLVSDLNNQKYVLADKESLTMSVENFSYVIEKESWTESNGKFEKVVFHDMSSESVIVSFIDDFKIQDKTISYEVLDESNIKVFSDSRKNIKCVINCALGAGNGYWQYLMDWSKIDFVDDTKTRNDRAYSSSKFEGTIKNYALKNDYFTKAVCDSRFGIKEFEHNHLNKNILDNLTDSKGDLYYNRKKILTELNPITYSSEQDFEFATMTEALDVKVIYEEHFLQAIIASEILLKNTSSTEEAIVKIRDGSLDLIAITLKPNEIQKYHLGISNRIKVLISGNVKTILTVAAF